MKSLPKKKHYKFQVKNITNIRNRKNYNERQIGLHRNSVAFRNLSYTLDTRSWSTFWSTPRVANAHKQA